MDRLQQMSTTPLDPARITDCGAYAQSESTPKGEVRNLYVDRIAHLERLLKTGSACELGADNPNLMDYMKHWEGRALKAEAQLERNMAGDTSRELPTTQSTPRADAVDDAADDYEDAYPAMTDLARTLERELAGEREHKNVLRDTFDSAMEVVFGGMECEPECDTHVHGPECCATHGLAAVKRLRARLESAEAALSSATEAREEQSILMLGGTYVTQGGEHVTMAKIHNVGTPYETLEDELGVNRYSRRLGDMGRATGTAHDYSDEHNIQRPIRAIALREIPAESATEAKQALIEEVIGWAHDGRLQTFEDRERFRKWARALKEPS